MALTELRWHKIDEPLPEPGKRGRRPERRAAVFDMLRGMSVGDVIEVEQGRSTLESYVYKFRISTDRAWRFRIRASDKLGWSRLWRVA